MEVSSTEKTVEEEDRVTELPEIPQLQHLAKNRPKRPKKHASSKNVVKVREGWVENNKILDATTFQLAEGEADDIKDGLDNFFSKTTSSPASQSLTPVGSPMVSRSREDLRMKVILSLQSKLCDSLSVWSEFGFILPTLASFVSPLLFR